MSTPPKTPPHLPQRQDPKSTSLDRPPDQRLLCPAQHLCSPISLPTPKSPKKPKIQMAGEIFPTDWSPPPVEFLNQKALQTQWVGAAGPQGRKRLPKELEQKPLDLDSKQGMTSLEELFWNMASPSQQPGTPKKGSHTDTSGSSENYVNSLDYLLQEKREQALDQKWEKLLQRDRPDPDSSNSENSEVHLMPEQRILVEKFSVSLKAIPPVHPGETVFLPRRHPLPCVLDSSHLKPHSHLEELFLSSPPDQQLGFLHSGLLSNLYLHASDCPVPLLQWLFQLLTWPPETSSRAFGLLWDLSVDGLFCQSDEDMRLWCPSLEQLAEAFHSLGAPRPDPCAPGPSQLSGSMAENKISLSCREQEDAPQEVALDISLSYIYKFLMLCVLMRPGSFSDQSLLQLMELLCRAGLDVGLRLLPKTDLQQLLLLLLEGVCDWPGKLQPLCSALSRVSNHHHNLLALVQFFPNVTARGRELRSQLSLVVITRMLGQQDALPLWREKTPLTLLGQLLSRMRPSSLRQHLHAELLPSGPTRQQQQAGAELDHKVCYLCHSLLMLAGVVVSSRDITPDQGGELQLLCMQLDRHINTHIRESPQAMHRTKLKDLATQMYIRWQELLTHCQPQAQYFSPWKST
ncbi:protein FAM178B [Perognathus longimembris pacificus]|uniref:protein FAM178B n=1 Tax=Perognathus longimembris pacificus TaxID=214514 RepID=UPI002019874F|nr:protein FAM178B [Perognathus longimembris pacificus]